MNKIRCEVVCDFTVKTPGGIRELKKGQIIRLPEQSVRLLVEAGKIKPLDEFTTAFGAAAHRLDKHYKPGALSYCKQRHPETYNKMIEVESRLNSMWDKGTDPAEFKKAVSAWESIHLELLRLFKKS